MIFLASPYSHPERTVREDRFLAAALIAGKYILKGYNVFSPISHSHPIYELVPETGESWVSWEAINHEMIDNSSEVWVLCLDGWERSGGIANEIIYAGDTGKPVKFLAANGEFIDDPRNRLQ